MANICLLLRVRPRTGRTSPALPREPDDPCAMEHLAGANRSPAPLQPGRRGIAHLGRGALDVHRGLLLRLGIAVQASVRAGRATSERLPMNFVQQYWEDYNGELLQQGLVDQLPVNQGGIDRRGFEWFAGNEGCPRGTSPSRGTPALSRAWRSAPTASGSPPPVRWDSKGMGRRDRTRNPTLRGHTAPLRRRVQPRRPAARLRQLGWDGKVVGRRDRTGNAHAPGAHRPCQRAWRSAPTASGSPPPVRTRR